MIINYILYPFSHVLIFVTHSQFLLNKDRIRLLFIFVDFVFYFERDSHTLFIRKIHFLLPIRAFKLSMAHIKICSFKIYNFSYLFSFVLQYFHLHYGMNSTKIVKHFHYLYMYLFHVLI